MNVKRVIIVFQVKNFEDTLKKKEKNIRLFQFVICPCVYLEVKFTLLLLMIRWELRNMVLESLLVANFSRCGDSLVLGMYWSALVYDFLIGRDEEVVPFCTQQLRQGPDQLWSWLLPPPMLLKIGALPLVIAAMISLA